MKLLLYCTKAKPYLYKHFKGKFFLSNTNEKICALNGLIVAECDFEVEEIKNYNNSITYYTKNLDHVGLLSKSYLGIHKLDDYLKGRNGYAIHIKNLHIFDELMGLSEYNKKIEYKKCENCEEHCKFYYSKNTMSGETNKGCTRYYRIQKAPQNMCYCYDASGNKNIIISIQPEWLVKILNGEKTIEVRKKVLKEML